ncbi:4995_t:CDS:2 [Acaulospora morrowiae]|uniref:4995_t:CDS:1 n=1 Tax=Acaulospora morrowiae TaxID=94023 RepID=A0A9N9FJ37_9GLOM|nr:4995_t:CDS:2 [Acaulospora morrowiae]
MKDVQKKYQQALSNLNHKVKDHDHISGKYRGPAHDACNKKLQMGAFKTKIPLICHNFRGYDSYLLIEVVSRFTANKLKCIPENIDKYKAMDVGQFRFLDSFQHMSMGLDKLVESLGKNLEKFPLTVKYFTNKGYSIDKIKIKLPRRKYFYSMLKQQNISKGDYEHAQKVWQEFEIINFGEYHDLYLETDDDRLDPSHYVSAPGMFNDSLYKSSKVEIKLMTDMDEYLMVENGIRGGMTMILGKVGPEEIHEIQSIAPDAEIGYMLEVDIETPINLHDFFADYSLALEKQIIPENWLSLYNERLVHDKAVGGGKYVTGEKLLQTLLPKKNYIVHYRVLQIYMKFGTKVTKIHSALKFHQSPWMKDYIEENIHKRKIAKANKEDFGVMYYKLKNNAVFGKKMENVRKHMRVLKHMKGGLQQFIC